MSLLSRHRTTPKRTIPNRLTRNPRALRLGAAAAMTAAVIGGTALPASAAPQSAYPRPARAYVWHPAGFNDPATVYVTRGIPHCQQVPLAPATYGNVRIMVRKELAPLFAELMRQTEVKYHYHLKPGLTGAFSCRMIDGSANVSNHAYGRAIDINWDTNPMASYFRSDIPPAVVKLWIDHGFYWGGHYTNKKDTMHFEYVAPLSAAPAFLAHLKAMR